MLLQRAFRLLQPLLADFVAQSMVKVYQNYWWKEVRKSLSDCPGLPESGAYAELAASLDLSACLRLLERRWVEIFRKRLPADCRSWGRELTGMRNRVAHLQKKDISDEDTWRTLDTMARLAKQLNREGAQELLSLREDFSHRYVRVSAPAAPAPFHKLAFQKGRLPDWQTIMRLYPEVHGEDASYAVTLSQNGKETNRHEDAGEWLARTVLTKGLSELAAAAFRRIASGRGPAVLAVEGNRGGGKSHALLALYHAVSGSLPPAGVEAWRSVLTASGLAAMPRAHGIVLSASAWNPGKGKRMPGMSRTVVHTLWGELAAQAAVCAERPSLYGLVREADRCGVSPGTDALVSLLEACGPVVILLDDMDRLIGKLAGAERMQGMYQNLRAFQRELSAAVRRCPRAVLVYSQNTDTASHLDEWQEAADAVFSPAGADEYGAIVVKRLFLPCLAPELRDWIVSRYQRWYGTHPSLLPVNAGDEACRADMLALYPFHPEWFVRLRGGSLRQTLRLSAAAVRVLYERKGLAMILPGDCPMEVLSVRREWLHRLSPNWKPLVERWEGASETALRRNGPARRMLRVILMESAAGETVEAHGLDRAHILLDALHPGEELSGIKERLEDLCGTAGVTQEDGRYRLEPPSMQFLIEAMAGSGDACCWTDWLAPETAEKAAAALLEALARHIRTRGQAARISLSVQFEDAEERGGYVMEAEATVPEETGTV